jgi:hypothetical protein
VSDDAQVGDGGGLLAHELFELRGHLLVGTKEERLSLPSSMRLSMTVRSFGLLGLRDDDVGGFLAGAAFHDR